MRAEHTHIYAKWFKKCMLHAKYYVADDNIRVRPYFWRQRVGGIESGTILSTRLQSILHHFEESRNLIGCGTFKLTRNFNVN